ncbi:MAG: phosphoribosylglycinamide formyltransferase [Spirochaetales bacterium]|nr:phosphoribosylglycinamide formyltransferase [Spirochaetales bacterium]
MANLAVFASGSGTNFEAITKAVLKTEHKVCCLICDKKDAAVFERAKKLRIPSFHVSYKSRTKAETEEEMIKILTEKETDLIALAGFMRLLTPKLVDCFKDRIINIHPSLLPKYPGTNGIKDSWESGDTELGITIHRIDYGLDTGPVIMQKSFSRYTDSSLEEVENRIHTLEHQFYPQVLLDILGSI